MMAGQYKTLRRSADYVGLLVKFMQFDTIQLMQAQGQ